mmetsp:Transcript_14725/g.19955  ORF Transcript_14725/g.19955 Transcript_14725/m.19955 type:complete len:202 (-) Transcript_14725:2999-3604(-)
MERAHQAKSGRGQHSGAGGGASLVAMINPTSPTGLVSKQLGKSQLQGTMGLGRDLGTNAMPITQKKNSGAATYARGRQELQGMGLIMSDKNGSSMRKHQGDFKGELRDSRAALPQVINERQNRDKDGRSYVSHSPQPYSKFKLQPTRNNLMIYGQNGHQPSADVLLSGGSPKQEPSGESKTLNAGPVTIRNANGYPVANIE